MLTQLSAVMEHGRIYIRDADTNWCEPLWMVRYYATRFGRHDLASFSHDIPDDKVEDIRVTKGPGYGYTLRFPGCGVDSTVHLSGDSKADRFEKEPYPCPKVRSNIQTRYHDGRWQKHLRNGWTDI